MLDIIVSTITTGISVSYWKTSGRRNGDKFIPKICEEVIQEYFNSLRRFVCSLIAEYTISSKEMGVKI